MGGRTGILGGTFDPVHNGHVLVAAQCRDRLGLDEVVLIPSFQPPHRDPPVASPEDRLEMTRLGVDLLPGLRVDDCEVRRGGVSYAVDTLRQLRAGSPGRRLVLLLGHDAALEFGGWRETPAILELAELAVFNRAGTRGVDREALLRAGAPGAVEVLEVDSPPVSATEVRRRLLLGDDVSGMVAASVLTYIRERGLYRAPE